MASSSVNVPTNPKIKEQDVNAKLQLYGIYSGMSTLSCSLAQSRPSQSQNIKLTVSQLLPMARFLRSVVANELISSSGVCNC
jgi:hypothetical protein